MAPYPIYEEYEPKREVNVDVRLLVTIIIIAFLIDILAYAIGFQQGSNTASIVNNTNNTEQPTYIKRNLNEDRYNYYNYHYYTNYDFYCPKLPISYYSVGRVG